MATYDDIIAYAPVAAFLQNRDTIAEMPQIVRRSQTYVTRRLDHDFFRHAFPGRTADATGVVTTGIDEGLLLEIRSISVVQGNRSHPVHPRDFYMLEALFYDQPRGVPQFWAHTPSGEIRIFPAPGREVTVDISANIKEPVLSPSQQENRISVHHPELMEQAVAMHVALFNLDAQAAQMYSDQLTELLVVVNAEIARRRRDETSQRPIEARNVTGS